MTENLSDLLKNTPIMNVPPVCMDDPNEPIKIHSGDFSLAGQDQVYNLNGHIEFRWFPVMGVKFHGEFLGDAKPKVNLLEEYEIVVKNEVFGKVRILDLHDRDKFTCGGEGKSLIWGNNAVPVNEITFTIPNMREFLGDSVKELLGTSTSMHKSRLTFGDKPYVITLDKLSDFKSRKEKLDQNGGYLLTYAGKIKKKKGEISLSELQKWHNRFHHFLYFLNGRRVAPMFYTGAFDDGTWTDYSGYMVDTYKYVPCWSDIFFVNDLPQLWKSYNRLWKDENDKDFLITAIHWYVEANSQAGMVEGSIILIQTALELIYNWLIIENQKMIFGGDAEGMSAANKIRLLIFQLKISPAIPPAFTELAKIQNVVDGPEVFVKIRNALVHGQGVKRAELKKITLIAQYQALQLGIWYVELALLYILGYQGKYNNRASGKQWKDTGELVPWMNDKTFKIGKPSDFTDEQISDFVELLEKQGKVKDPSENRVKRCKYLAMGFSWGRPVSIGAIKQKTAIDFTPAKANLPELAKDYEWEAGYFFTEPEFQGKGFSSMILNQLLALYGSGRLMASTEIREGNTMINSLERRNFKQVGSIWKSVTSGNDLRLFLRDLPEKTDWVKSLKQKADPIPKK